MGNKLPFGLVLSSLVGIFSAGTDGPGYTEASEAPVTINAAG